MSVLSRIGSWSVGATLGFVLCIAVGVAVGQTAPPEGPPDSPELSAKPVPQKRTVRTFKVYGDNWNWTPDKIHVKQGDHVVLKLESFRASRSFVLKAYNLDALIPQDREVTAEFDATVKGEFPYKCGRPCGNGCAKLRGTLYVE